jgi:hypothetical protein
MRKIKDSTGNFPSNAVAVLHLFDNVAYHAVTIEETINPCQKDNHGKYHVDGDLLLAPPEVLAPYVKNCTLIFTELAEVPEIVLSPLSKYLTRGLLLRPGPRP